MVFINLFTVEVSDMTPLGEFQKSVFYAMLQKFPK